MHLSYDATRECPSLKQWSEIRSRKMCKIENKDIQHRRERTRTPRIITVVPVERAAIQIRVA